MPSITPVQIEVYKRHSLREILECYKRICETEKNDRKMGGYSVGDPEIDLCDAAISIMGQFDERAVETSVDFYTADMLLQTQQDILQQAIAAGTPYSDTFRDLSDWYTEKQSGYEVGSKHYRYFHNASAICASLAYRLGAM